MEMPVLHQNVFLFTVLAPMQDHLAYRIHVRFQAAPTTQDNDDD